MKDWEEPELNPEDPWAYFFFVLSVRKRVFWGSKAFEIFFERLFVFSNFFNFSIFSKFFKQVLQLSLVDALQAQPPQHNLLPFRIRPANRSSSRKLQRPTLDERFHRKSRYVFILDHVRYRCRLLLLGDLPLLQQLTPIRTLPLRRNPMDRHDPRRDLIDRILPMG